MPNLLPLPLIVFLGIVICGLGGLLAGIAARYSDHFNSPTANRFSIGVLIITLGAACFLGVPTYISQGSGPGTVVFTATGVASLAFFTCGYTGYPRSLWSRKKRNKTIIHPA